MQGSQSFYLPVQLITGIDCAYLLADEVKKFAAQKVFLITDEGVKGAGLIDGIEDILNKCGVSFETYDQVPPEPAVKHVDHCAELAREFQPDLVLGVGGGSVLDIAKATAVLMTNPGSIKDYFGIGLVEKHGIPSILMPTTSGTGSEVTPNAIFLDEDTMVKVGVVSPHIFGNVAIVDAMLTLSAPPKLTAATGVDAFTHAVESYTSVRATLHSDVYAQESIRRIARSLRTAFSNPGHIQARYDMSIGSVYGGIALSNAGTGAVHALAYPLGGSYGVPHGVSNALLLPYVMEFNYIGNLEKFSNIALLMGEDIDGLSPREGAQKALQAIKDLVRDVQIPSRLQDVGVEPEAAPRLADAASGISRLLNNNPRKITRDEILAIYQKAL